MTNTGGLDKHRRSAVFLTFHPTAPSSNRPDYLAHTLSTPPRWLSQPELPLPSHSSRSFSSRSRTASSHEFPLNVLGLVSELTTLPISTNPLTAQSRKRQCLLPLPSAACVPFPPPVFACVGACISCAHLSAAAPPGRTPQSAAWLRTAATHLRLHTCAHAGPTPCGATWRRRRPGSARGGCTGVSCAVCMWRRRGGAAVPCGRGGNKGPPVAARARHR